MKYDLNDFEKVANDEATLDEMAKKYGVARDTFRRSMNTYGYHVKKTKFRITSPHKVKVVYSYSSCASELNVSIETVRQAINGKQIKLFEDMGIKVEVIK